MKKNRIPVAIFVYKRLDVTKKMIEALKENIGLENCDIYIYSDGPKKNKDRKKVEEVREYLYTIKELNSLKIKKSPKNKGLANSIIEGISEILKEYENVIVLEDDLVTSKYFIKYMTDCLENYKKNMKIWSISGYVPPLKHLENYKEDIFLIRKGASWGWATWRDRWEKIDWEIKEYKTFKENIESIKEFNKVGNNMSKMLELQMKGKIDSWAVRWIYNQYKFNQYTIYPRKSLVKNIGFGNDATHGSIDPKRWESNISKEKLTIPKDIERSKILEKKFKNYYDLKINGRIAFFLKVKLPYVHSFIKKILSKI